MVNGIAWIISNIKKGLLTREIDEKGAGGFWDYAGDVAYNAIFLSDIENVHESILNLVLQELQEQIYNDLWEVYECSGKRLGN